jgi:hypothetical protein
VIVPLIWQFRRLLMTPTLVVPVGQLAAGPVGVGVGVGVGAGAGAGAGVTSVPSPGEAMLEAPSQAASATADVISSRARRRVFIALVPCGPEKQRQGTPVGLWMRPRMVWPLSAIRGGRITAALRILGSLVAFV